MRAVSVGVLLSCLSVSMAQVSSPRTATVEPLKIAVDQPAYTGLPIWVHTNPGRYYIRYPFSPNVGDIGCNRLELQFNDEPVKPWAIPTDEISSAGILCGSSALPLSPQDRIPLHILYPLLKPGVYRVRWTVEEPNFQDANRVEDILRDAARSDWTTFTVLQATPARRESWLSRLLKSPPSDPALITGDYIPSLVAAAPNERALEAIGNQLYSSNDLVAALATSAMRFFPNDRVSDLILAIIERRGPSDAIARILSMDKIAGVKDGAARRVQVVRRCIDNLQSNDPTEQAAALETIHFLVHLPNNKLPVDPSLAAEADAKVMEAARAIVAANQDQPQSQLAIYLGSLKTREAHELLKRMAYSASPVAEQARISLLRNPQPDDLPELAALMFQPGEDSDQDGSQLSGLPGNLISAFGDRAIPAVEKAMADSPYIWVQTAAAEELVRKNDPAAFSFFLDALINDRWSWNHAYKGQLIQFLKDNFPSQVPRAADQKAITDFLQKHASLD